MCFSDALSLQDLNLNLVSSAVCPPLVCPLVDLGVQCSVSPSFQLPALIPSRCTSSCSQSADKPRQDPMHNVCTTAEFGNGEGTSKGGHAWRGGEHRAVCCQSSHFPPLVHFHTGIPGLHFCPCCFLFGRQRYLSLPFSAKAPQSISF